jgi:hypothetical protein
MARGVTGWPALALAGLVAVGLAGCSSPTASAAYRAGYIWGMGPAAPHPKCTPEQATRLCDLLYSDTAVTVNKAQWVAGCAAGIVHVQLVATAK